MGLPRPGARNRLGAAGPPRDFLWTAAASILHPMTWMAHRVRYVGVVAVDGGRGRGRPKRLVRRVRRRSSSKRRAQSL